jgi:RecB family endonuclease NucS
MITPEQFREMEARVAPKCSENEMPSFRKESDLHDKIIAELIRRRWYFVHSRMDCRTTQLKGVPDFICASPDGRTFWIEVKRKGAKLTKEQNVARHCLLVLGHKWACVYSFQEFLTAVNL